MKLKSVIVSLLVVTTAFVSQAALVDWQLDCYEFGSDVSGYTLYLLESADGASTYATALSGKTYADASAFSTAIGAVTGTLDGDATAAGTYNGGASYLSALIIANTSEGAAIYYTDGFATSGHTYAAGDMPADPIEIWDTDFQSGGVIAYDAGGGGGGAPEPTSGLLLLIGGSLLALRRKQK